jgi:hypothetical protein
MARLTTSLFGFGVLLALAPGAFANTIVSVTGPGASTGSSASLGGAGNDTLAASWTTSGAYTDVSIAAEVGCYQCNGLTLTAYLTTAIGPLETVADQLATSSFTTDFSAPPGLPEMDTLFSGLSLSAGTYYLVLNDPSGAGPGYWLGAGTPTVNTGPDVTFDGDTAFDGTTYNETLNYANTNPPSLFGGSLCCTLGPPLSPSQEFLFQVTGDVAGGSSTPEPGSTSLPLTGGLCGLCLWKRRRLPVAE